MIWFDLISYDFIWFYMTSYDLIWFDMIWFDLIWFDLIWFDFIWFDLISYDLIWFDLKYQTLVYYDDIHDMIRLIFFDVISLNLIFLDGAKNNKLMTISLQDVYPSAGTTVLSLSLSDYHFLTHSLTPSLLSFPLPSLPLTLPSSLLDLHSPCLSFP